MTFEKGDAVVHPDYGAGIVTEVKELAFLGNGKKSYYSIELLGNPETVVMVPVRKADDVGLRPVITESKLKQIWSVLGADPNELPSDHNKRYDRLKTKLYSGDILEIAEVLRDLAWRREEKRRLTMRGKRLYNKGMEFLSAEVAGAQDSNVEEAESEISELLFRSMSTGTVA